MEVWNYLGTHCRFGEAETTPVPDNENLPLLPAWMTPAELLQWITQEKAQMRKELAADFRLRSNPKHRQDWDNLNALERCTLFQCYGEG